MGQGVIRQENGKWGWFLNEEGAQAFEYYLSPVVKGIAPPEAIGITGDSRLQMMADGKVAIEMGAVYDMPQYKDNYPNAVVKAMPTPIDAGDSIFYRAGGEGMSITANCEHPAEAAKFLFWVMEPKNMASYAYPNGMVPANFAALDQEPFASDPQWEITRKYLDEGTVFVTPYNPNFVEFRDTVLSPLLMEVVNGTKTFAEANAELETGAAEILNR
jgi:ABC-type glycerol-3-phosphate transport system substrate-binding protein